MRKSMLIAVAILITTAAARAQTSEDVAKRQKVEGEAIIGRQFVVAERVPLEKGIKDAPYSAEIVTEMNQALADGNRISRRTTGRVYRDSEGRIRREEDRQNGTVAISIVDAVAGVSYRLEPETRIAWKTSAAAGGAILNKIEAARIEERRKMEAERRTEAEHSAIARSSSGGEPARTARPPPPPPPPPLSEDLRNEGPLERKTLEGIVVVGRKNTSTIPAGQIGNEQPITITSEEWRSPELNVLVMTHHIDPRMGESSYRLTNIVRGEPDPSLFQVPAGYTIKETGIRREFQRQ
jgi:hypothetical protein